MDAAGSIGTQMTTPQAFKAKWRVAALKERSSAQEHFLDICHMLGQPTPAEADPDGSWFTFEKGASKSGGSNGFADVWLRGRFAWEYKGNHADLRAAYQQLLQYREALENPPLLVVSDLTRFEVHTNFTGTVKQIHAFTLEEIDQTEPLRVLRALFSDPEQLRPQKTVEAVTREAAAHFAEIAIRLQDRRMDPHRVAHFLVQLLFCMFAEDIGLLPNKVFSRLVALGVSRPAAFSEQVEQLLGAMRDGGIAGLEVIDHFNGGLFAEIAVVPLDRHEIGILGKLVGLDWSNIEPAIFGTLFERSLDPSRRAQLGAHYTSRADIERVVEPVVLAPLRRRWAEVRTEADRLKAIWDGASIGRAKDNRRQAFANHLFAFQEELARVRVLDPACGSGNFLYVALAALKELEKEIVSYGTANGLPQMLPRVGPGQLHGLEISDYARELTQVVVWIGYLQWMTANGYQVNRDPVLQTLETIRLQDSLLDLSDPAQPREAVWPEADFIIGNPPFLGGKRTRSELGDDYVEHLHRVFAGRLPPFADLVCYFFEKAREQIAEGHAKRAGLLATNSIRGGANRVVLDRIKETGDIFMGWDDEPWILDGAAVRISIVGFDDGSETQHTLDGRPVAAINSDLTAGVDLSVAQRLLENQEIAFIGDQPTGPFEVEAELAQEWLQLPTNPNGRPNSDVLRPYMNGADITRRPRGSWIVDFGVDMPEQDAALYEAPFEYIRQQVLPVRANNRNATARKIWWLHWRPRPAMRAALKSLPRFLCTPTVAKHRLFVWLPCKTLPDHQLVAFAREDDYFFGVLHSKAHELWSLRMCTWLGKGNDPRYTPTTCFETFPFPCPSEEQRAAIAEAARELSARRDAWLNPPGPSGADLKTRTLTNLYNARPTWLAQAHETLDRAVFAAYGWDDLDSAAVDQDELLARLLALNLARGSVGA